MSSAFCCSCLPCEEPNQIVINIPDVQSMEQVDDLIEYIEQIIRKVDGGDQQQINQPASAASSSIASGGNLLDRISKRLNWHVCKKPLLSALDRETRKVLSDVLNEAQIIPYLGMALSVIAHTLERAEQVSSNRDKCLGFLRDMFVLAKHLKNLEIHLHQNNLIDILLNVVKGTLMCARQMVPGNLCRFIFAPVDAAALDNLRSDVQRLYFDLQLRAQEKALSRLHTIPGPSQGEYPQNAVYIEKAQDKVIELLDLTNLKLKVVAIYGVGGIGKTTLAAAVFNRLDLTSYNYCRIEMDHDCKKSDLQAIQEQLLSNLFQKQLKLNNCTQGREELSKAIVEASKPGAKPFFLFIDNALKEKHLKEVLPIDHLSNLPMQSRIFLTTRNLNEINILRCQRAIEVCDYRVEPLLDPEAKRLLCHYALGDKDSSFDPGVNMDKLLQVCGGIPLVLQIVGSKLSDDGNTVSACNAIIKYYEEWLLKGCEGGDDVSEIIVDFVYNGLREASREAFLDIVFFYYGWEPSTVAGFVGEVCLKDLERTSLVFTTAKYGRTVVNVHDIVRARGKRLSEGNRIIDKESLSFILRNEQKLEQTKGIWLPHEWEAIWFNDTWVRHFNNKVKSMMIEAKHVDLMSKSLRVLSLGNAITIKGRCHRAFQDLRFLDIAFEDVFPLDLRKSSLLVYFKSWSKNGQGFPQLPKSLPYLRLLHLDGALDSPISLDIGHLDSLIKLELTGLKSKRFSFQNICSLQTLKLILCSQLKRLPENFGDLTSLQTLEMNDCSNLETLPESFGNLSSMRELDLHGCSMLERLPESSGYLSSLQKLDLHGCSMLERLPESVGYLSSLQMLDLHGCSMLERLPESFGYLSSLQMLDLHGCSMLERLPRSFGDLSSLQDLEMSSCFKLEGLESLGNLSSLQFLKMHSCERIPENIGNLSCLEQLKMNDCSMLERLPESIGNLSSLRRLKMNDCSKLERLPESFGNLSSMQVLDLIGCSKLERLPESFGNLSSMLVLDLIGCSILERLPESFGNLSSLECLKLNDCSKLQRLPQTFDQLTQLYWLEIDGCEKLCSLIDNIGGLKCLKFLSIRNCKELKRLPEDIQCSTSLAAVKAYGCDALEAEAIDSLVEIKSLMFLEIGESPMLIKRWQEILQEDRPLIGAALRFEPDNCPYEEIMSAMFFSCGSRIVQIDGEGQVAEVASSCMYPEVGVKVALLLTPWAMSDEVRQEVWEVTSSEFQIIYVDVDVDGEAEGSRWMEERDHRIREALEQLPPGSRAWTSPFPKTNLLFAYLLSRFARMVVYENVLKLGRTPYTSVVGTSVFVDEEGRRKLSPLQLTFRINDSPSGYYRKRNFHPDLGTFNPMEKAWQWMAVDPKDPV